MSPLTIGILIGIASVVVLASGIPVAFGLVVVALMFLAVFDGVGSLVLAGELFFLWPGGLHVGVDTHVHCHGRSRCRIARRE